jgi:hypothetical protein
LEGESLGAQASDIFLFSLREPKKFRSLNFFLDSQGKDVQKYTKFIGKEGVMDRPQIFNNLGWWWYFYYYGGVCPSARKT